MCITRPFSHPRCMALDMCRGPAQMMAHTLAPHLFTLHTASGAAAACAMGWYQRSAMRQLHVETLACTHAAAAVVNCMMNTGTKHGCLPTAYPTSFSTTVSAAGVGTTSPGCRAPRRLLVRPPGHPQPPTRTRAPNPPLQLQAPAFCPGHRVVTRPQYWPPRGGVCRHVHCSWVASAVASGRLIRPAICRLNHGPSRWLLLLLLP